MVPRIHRLIPVCLKIHNRLLPDCGAYLLACRLSFFFLIASRPGYSTRWGGAIFSIRLLFVFARACSFFLVMCSCVSCVSRFCLCRAVSACRVGRVALFVPCCVAFFRVMYCFFCARLNGACVLLYEKNTRIRRIQ